MNYFVKKGISNVALYGEDLAGGGASLREKLLGVLPALAPQVVVRLSGVEAIQGEALLIILAFARSTLDAGRKLTIQCDEQGASLFRFLGLESLLAGEARSS
ncbi:MAG: hypothetical protein JNM27_06175 [Leptospirales bacterium]|nr:hypothetical protein [Leptospirales bacterium]